MMREGSCQWNGEYVHAHRLESAQQIADGVCKCARAFEADQGQLDDITAIIVETA